MDIIKIDNKFYNVYEMDAYIFKSLFNYKIYCVISVKNISVKHSV